MIATGGINEEQECGPGAVAPGPEEKPTGLVEGRDRVPAVRIVAQPAGLHQLIDDPNADILA